MRPIFCGNFEFDARQSELERLFRKYGKVDRLDMKSGFAFVYMEDERDAEDAIRGLDQIEFGRKCRRLRVEWTKQERSNKRPENARKPLSNSKPSKTLFVINFDPYHTRTRDLERHFDKYGKIQNVRIRRNFAFIQFEVQEDATKALEATNLSKLMDRVISVEYANKDDDDRRNGGESPDRRSRERSPRRREYGGGRRSPSPHRRREERGSPDYGRGRRSLSPNKGGGGRRASPDYGGRRASPDYGGRRASPDYGGRRASPDYGGRRASPDYGGRRVSPDYGHHHHRRSPKERNNNDDYHGRSPSPPSRGTPGPPPPKDDNNNYNDKEAGMISRSISPKRQQTSNADDEDDHSHNHNHRSPSPAEDSRVEMRTSPTNYGADSPEGGVSEQ